MSVEKFYTEAEVGDILGAHESKVGKWRRQFNWPHFRFGREVRYTEADVQDIVRRHRVSAEQPKAIPGQTSLSARRSA